ncbi:uncharacterized protein CANTADRAFT_25452, partial [Suhomyces tanzawaensis NRRL Y-17324]
MGSLSVEQCGTGTMTFPEYWSKKPSHSSIAHHYSSIAHTTLLWQYVSSLPLALAHTMPVFTMVVRIFSATPRTLSPNATRTRHSPHHSCEVQPVPGRFPVRV